MTVLLIFMHIACVLTLLFPKMNGTSIVMSLLYNIVIGLSHTNSLFYCNGPDVLFHFNICTTTTSCNAMVIIWLRFK
ncbi:transmembrane protein, putative [Medicago truncatula]|uniref:Transmembrane protein, putative n=1 Tax=Medicago truncatula TaxID=3880 RepID=G7K4T9_MEDTR|nr:transmembrane protein, putative [Medicago truncatula]